MDLDTEEIDRMLESLAAAERQLNRTKAMETERTAQTTSGEAFSSSSTRPAKAKVEELDPLKHITASKLPVFHYPTLEEKQVKPDPEKATKLKDKGNDLFKAGRYQEAIDLYTQAIAADPTSDIYPANRAMAYLKLNKHKEAESDCTTALSLQPKNVKALLRRATAREAMGSIEGARKDYLQVLQLEPSNNQAATGLKQLDKISQSATTVKPKSQQQTQPKAKLYIEPPAEKPDARPATSPPSATSNAKPKPQTKPTTSTQTAPTPSKTTQSQEPAKVVPSQQKPVISETKSPAAKATPQTASKQSSSASATQPSSKIGWQSGSQSGPQSGLPPLKINVVVPKNAPKTSYELEMAWKYLRADQEKLYQYLQMIPPSTYSTVFSEFFTEDMFGDLLRVLHDCYQRDQHAIQPILLALPKISRFNIVMAFLSQKNKQLLKAILDRLSTGESGEKLDTQQVMSLASQYRLSGYTCP
eukprot:comp23744_c0_seq1/m.40983 comp23744_c0_seq1/g.40983  ORF comp23744_c0_seq1/g.40983 comp23744_c0_seq1/m.40983 type:complete len:473 (-) comp23744_c0_seq1:298-1716(-)